MNTAQEVALERFKSFYPAFLSALEREDAERIEALVEARQDALAELLEAFEGCFLPEAVRLHIEGSEAMVHTRLMRFQEQIMLRLYEERGRSFAAARYQESSR